MKPNNRSRNRLEMFNHKTFAKRAEYAAALNAHKKAKQKMLILPDGRKVLSSSCECSQPCAYGFPTITCNNCEYLKEKTDDIRE